MNQQLALIQNTETPDVQATNYAPKEVAFVKPFEQQLALIEGEFSKFVFDYSNADDNEQARSLIRKLQKSRTAIEKVAKAERDPAILYQRHVIDEEKKLTVRVQKLIDQYEKPLKEWEAQDQLRKDAIQARIRIMRPDAEYILTATAKELSMAMENVQAVDPDISFDEFSSEAFAQRITTLEYLKEHVAIAEAREAAAARLAQLEAAEEARRIADEEAAAKMAAEQEEKEKFERLAKLAADLEVAQKKADEDRLAREEQLKKDAAESARIAAEEKAAADAAEAAERERVLKEQLAKQEADRVAAEQKAKDDAAAAVKLAEEKATAAVVAEQKRVSDEKSRFDAEEARKAADKAHRGKIHSEIVSAICDVFAGVREEDDPEATAKAIVIAICGDAIPHLKILY